jgi:Immunoglobulin I-set domain
VSIHTGGRYTQDAYGLRIQNITTDDNGIYNCRAEVDSEGRYDEKSINVDVYSKFSTLGLFSSEVEFYTNFLIDCLVASRTDCSVSCQFLCILIAVAVIMLRFCPFNLNLYHSSSQLLQRLTV